LYGLDNYQTARDKLTKAVETSNLESSSTEDNGNRKLRKRIRKNQKTLQGPKDKRQKLVSVPAQSSTSEEESDDSDTEDNPVPPGTEVFLESG